MDALGPPMHINLLHTDIHILETEVLLLDGLARTSCSLTLIRQLQRPILPLIVYPLGPFVKGALGGLAPEARQDRGLAFVVVADDKQTERRVWASTAAGVK